MIKKHSDDIDMKLSIYCPSRNRWGYLGYSIASWVCNAENPKRVEIIVAVDEDDLDTEKVLMQINKCVINHGGDPIVMVKCKRYGYEYLDKYHNDAITHSTGESFIVLGDEMICATRGWDTKMVECLKETYDVPTFIFPNCNANKYAYGNEHLLPRVYGINRKWYEITKNIGGWRAADVYYDRLLSKVHKHVSVIFPKIEILNLREESDVTFDEGRGALNSDSRGHFECDGDDSFKSDIEKLTAYATTSPHKLMGKQIGGGLNE
tara:strand:- start:1369 stop:2160 length:792 start_codon:yes stop_codon:yes gene_type:complete